jgi:hypothetical protein
MTRGLLLGLHFLPISSHKIYSPLIKGELGFENPTGGRGRGVPRRAEKDFYLYVSREAKEALDHLSRPSGGSKGVSSPSGAQTEASAELRRVF